MSKIIITAGSAYVDIDALASSIAYQGLLKAQGFEVIVCHTGTFNATIPPYLAEKALEHIQRTPPQLTDETSFVLVDVSDPAHFEKFVDLKRVTAIFDHHFGFENYWQSRLSSQAIIRPIGACATLIWQEYEKYNVQISLVSAEFLATAILSNTLNLQASITTEEDKKALSILEFQAQLGKDWKADYYNSTKEFLLNSPEKSILSDTKYIHFDGLPLHFCQIETWNAQEIIDQIPFNELCSKLFTENSWLLSLLDISSGQNWLLSNHSMVIKSLKDKLHLKSHQNWFKSQNLWLRKEILKFWQETNRIHDQ